MMTKKRRWNGLPAVRRVVAGFLAFVLLSSLFVGGATTAKAATWMDPYLNTVLEWGVIEPDQKGEVDGYKKLTRADFVAMVNRAFGYTEVGANHFVDVPEHAWYAEDICIAYKAGYLIGTSPNTASPNDMVTREQATVMLARNLRLQPTSGEVLDFHDSRQMANWSRGLVQQAARLGIVEGYANGNFGPRDTVTQGQMAALIARALGTRIQEPGEYNNVGAYTHLTITSPGVTLKNAVITGNLYLAGGVALEDVILENVSVEGNIVVAGGGIAQAGKNTVILRNVTAQELVVDNLTGQMVSVRAEGLTDIGLSDVRTSAYLEDVTKNGLGLKKIEFDGVSGSLLQLAGNIKEVVNRTPNSTLDMAQGVAGIITVDEAAIGTTVNIGSNAYIKDLNLDAGTVVDGTGDIDHLDVAAPGSEVTMLPDTITVRPGLNADIYGEEMDTAAAAESSEDPRILSGYPKALDVAPKTAQIAFSTNKKGTLYWAVTAVADGSVNEAELVKPSSYTTKVIKSGTIAVNASDTEFLAKLSGLTSGGSYYVSALLEDNRGTRSPVKVMAFATPDDTTPAFTQGYPVAILTADAQKNTVLQANVMANKDCRLYYALLPAGSVAPKAADFKAAAVSGNIGYGSEDLRKNTPFLIPQINTSRLKEQTKYDLYLWLTDIDGNKSSAVKKLTVETPDKTPPKIQRLEVTDRTAKSIKLSFSLDEPGTFYWAIVKQGTQFYSSEVDDSLESKQSDTAKRQIETGLGALKKGSKTATKASTDYDFTISGLEPQTTYELYYVAKDKSGNYNTYVEPLVPPMAVNTQDNQPPTVKQEFTHDGSETGTKLEPYPDTSIRLIFSERVMGLRNENGKDIESDFYQMYKDNDTENLAKALRHHIELYEIPVSGKAEKVPVKGDPLVGADDWVIDYSKAVITLDTQGMVITFPYHSTKAQSALNLASGATYYFDLVGIRDTAAGNPMAPTAGADGATRLEKFTTIDAQIVLSQGTSVGKDENGSELLFDMNFRLTPVTASSVSSDIMWDLLFWSNNNITFELYYRDIGEDIWKQVNPSCLTNNYAYDADVKAKINTSVGNPRLGVSLAAELLSTNADNPTFEQLNLLEKEREYGMIITSLGTSPRSEYDSWSGTVSINVVAVSGDRGSMREMTKNLTPEDYDKHQNTNLAVKEITVPVTGYPLTYTFRDKTPPTFTNNYPQFEPGDAGVNMEIMLSRGNTSYYYVIAEAGAIPTTFIGTDGIQHSSSEPPTNIEDGSGAVIGKKYWYDYLPTDGAAFHNEAEGNVMMPGTDSITNPPYSEDTGKYLIGHGDYSGGVITIPEPKGLKADTDYVVYFVLEGDSPTALSDVFAFHFKTDVITRPILTVSLSNPVAYISADREADVKFMLVIAGQEGQELKKLMSTCWQDSTLYPLDADTKAKYQALSIVEAMEQPHKVGGKVVGCVFDLFADTTTHDAISSWFSRASTDGVSIMKIGEMTLNTKNELIDNYNCKGDMTQGNQQYWMIAMGSSPLGSGYAFSAAGYLFYPSSTPPQVISLSTETVYPALVNDWGKARNLAYTGTVTITFDNYLYFKVNDKTYKQVVDKTNVYVNDSTYISSIQLLRSTNANVKPLHDGRDDNPPCSSLVVEFTGVRMNGTIEFNQNLSNSRGVTGTNALTLKMRLVEDDYGYFEPEFYISTPGWDATID